MQTLSHYLQNTLGLRAVMLVVLFTGMTLHASAQEDTVVSTNPDFVEFGTVETGDSTSKDFTISNLSDESIEVTITSPGEPFYILNDGLEGGGTFTLAAGQERDINLRYKPTMGDTPPLVDSSTITVSYEVDEENPRTGEKIVELRGQARRDNGGNSGSGDGEVTADANNLDFGEIAEDESTARSVTLENNDNQDVTVTVEGLDFPFSVQSGGGTATLEPGEMRTVRVRFAPTEPGEYRDTLMIIYTPQNGESDTIMIPVFGTAEESDDDDGGGGGDDQMGRRSITADPSSIQFSSTTEGDESTRGGMLENNTDQTVQVMVSGVDAPFFITEGGGTYDIPAGEMANIMVAFRPEAPGIYEDSIVVTYTAPDGNSYTRYIPLQGRATVDESGDGGGGDGGGSGDPVATDVLRTSTQMISFGNVTENQVASRAITLRNSDQNDTVQIAGLVSGANSQEFTIVEGGGPFTLAPGETRTVRVRFAPMSAGFFTDSVVIDAVSLLGSMPADTNRTVLMLSGRGVAADDGGGGDGGGDGGGGGDDNIDVTFDNDDIRFNDGDTVDLDQPVLDTIMITNNEDRPVTFQVFDPENPFAIVSGGGLFTLQPGESRTIVVRFLSTLEGGYNDFIRIVYGPQDNLNTLDIILRGFADDLGTGSVDIARTGAGASISALYPNPTSTGSAAITLELPQSTNVEATLYNRLGESQQTLFSGTMEAGTARIPADLSGLPNGTYYVRIALDGEIVTRTISVVR